MGGGQARSIAKFLYHYLLAPADGSNGWGPSWYLIAMMISLAIVVFFVRNKYLKIILGIASIGIELYYILATEFQKWTGLSDKGVHGFLRVIIYIFIGYLIAKYYDKIAIKSMKVYLILFAITLVLFIMENLVIWKLGGSSNSQEVITTVPTSTATALFSLKWQPKLDKPDFRKFSTFLYCSQMYPFFILNKFLNPNIILGQVLLFIGVILIAGIGYLIYKWITKKTEWSFLNYMV